VNKLNHERPHFRLIDNYKKAKNTTTTINNGTRNHKADHTYLPKNFVGLDVSSDQLVKSLVAYIRADLARHRIEKASSDDVIGKKTQVAAEQYDFRLEKLSQEFEPLFRLMIVELDGAEYNSESAVASWLHILGYMKFCHDLELDTQAEENLWDHTVKRIFKDHFNPD